MNMAIKKVFHAESQFLAGPNSRGREFLFLFKVLFQFLKGFRTLHFVGPCITVFGSARFTETHRYYQQARELGKMISEMGFAVMTGGGPGIMEAANRGAYDTGGISIGCTIKLPNEQTNNPFINKVAHFDYFFIRKVLLTKYSYGFVVMPGGFGTLDELFETLTLIQTGILHNFPVVIIGKEYYKDVMEMVEKMKIEKTIAPEDEKLLLFTDSNEEACDHIRIFIQRNYKIKYKASWILGEN